GRVAVTASDAGTRAAGNAQPAAADAGAAPDCFIQVPAADRGHRSHRGPEVPARNAGTEATGDVAASAAHAGPGCIHGVADPGDDAAPLAVVVPVADHQVVRAALVVEQPLAAGRLALRLVPDPDVVIHGAERAHLLVAVVQAAQPVVTDDQVAGAVAGVGGALAVDHLQVHRAEAHRGAPVDIHQRDVVVDGQDVGQGQAQLLVLGADRRDFLRLQVDAQLELGQAIGDIVDRRVFHFRPRGGMAGPDERDQQAAG